jgi:hypothetical protein
MKPASHRNIRPCFGFAVSPAWKSTTLIFDIPSDNMKNKELV